MAWHWAVTSVLCLWSPAQVVIAELCCNLCLQSSVSDVAKNRLSGAQLEDSSAVQYSPLQCMVVVSSLIADSKRDRISASKAYICALADMGNLARNVLLVVQSATPIE